MASSETTSCASARCFSGDAPPNPSSSAKYEEKLLQVPHLPETFFLASDVFSAFR